MLAHSNSKQRAVDSLKIQDGLKETFGKSIEVTKGNLAVMAANDYRPDAESANPYAFSNPYAPLSAVGEPPVVGSTQGIFAVGKTLYVPRSAELPDVCVKSNRPSDFRLKRKLHYLHPLIYLLILANLLIFIVVALIVQKSHTIHIGLTDEWRKRRLKRIALAWLLCLGGLAVFMFGIVVTSAPRPIPFAAWLIILGGLSFLSGLFVSISCRLVYAGKIGKRYYALKGCHPDFVARFPHASVLDARQAVA